jgi:hypothetical protein
MARRTLRAMPAIPGIPPNMPPPPAPPMLPIIWRMYRNFCTSSPTDCSVRPEPPAMRRTRDGSRIKLCGSWRSARVIDKMMVSASVSSLSLTCAAAPGGSMLDKPGILSIRSRTEPIF